MNQNISSLEAKARSKFGEQRTPSTTLNIPRRVLRMGTSSMVLGCFSAQGTGPIHKINGIMDCFVFKDIIEILCCHMLSGEMPLKWIFQQYNYPKHTSKIVKKFLTYVFDVRFSRFKEENITIM